MATRSRNQEYRSGLTLAQTVLARWPTGYAHLLLATEMIAAGDHQAALGQLRQAVADAPRAEYALGVELMQAGEWDAALDHLQAFVRKEPALLEVVSARNLIGRILMRRGELDAAADQFRLVLQMAPRFGEAHRNLADALAAGRRFSDAIDEYQRYVSRPPSGRRGSEESWRGLPEDGPKRRGNRRVSSGTVGRSGRRLWPLVTARLRS